MACNATSVPNSVQKCHILNSGTICQLIDQSVSHTGALLRVNLVDLSEDRVSWKGGGGPGQKRESGSSFSGLCSAKPFAASESILDRIFCGFGEKKPTMHMSRDACMTSLTP